MFRINPLPKGKLLTLGEIFSEGAEMLQLG